MSMSMGSMPVEPWFAALPLDDPRCNNDSCDAFLAGHTASQAEISWASQFLYGWWLTWGFSIVIFLFSLVYAFHLLQAQRHPAEKESGSPTALDKGVAAVRRLTYLRKRGKIAEFLSLPSLGVAALFLLFFAGSTIMAFAQHPYYRGRRGFGSPPLAVRTGLMAFALYPLEIALAGKVNLVTWITGVGHEKLNVFHRWTGWLLLFLSVVHTVPFIVQPLQEGGPAALYAKYYKPGSLEFSGTPPLGMLFGLVLLSLPPIRRAAYEAFVHAHWALAIEGDSWNYLWATTAIWALSIAVRMFSKMSLFNPSGAMFGQGRGVLTTLPGNMIRLEVDIAGVWKWEPGQHFFLRFATLRPLDNHPFTACNLAPKKRVDDRDTKMVFLVRPYNGVTKLIGQLAEAGETVGVSVDGAYGTKLRPRPASRYTTAIFVAGGGGISGLLPWLHHFSDMLAEGTTTIRSIVLVWAMRSKECANWVEDELEAIQDRAQPGQVSYEIWITDQVATVQAGSHGSVEASSKDKEIGRASGSQSPAPSLLANARVGARPKLGDLIPSLIGSKSGRTIVLGCGPESLKIDLSNAIAVAQGKVLSGEVPEIRLHTETFGPRTVPKSTSLILHQANPGPKQPLSKHNIGGTSSCHAPDDETSKGHPFPRTCKLYPADRGPSEELQTCLFASAGAS
ncbi:hypothetical protein GQ53DRAFT_812616 [Thozetella sp. PMI_491]|nr:hypothetical protein GQ53DRAFT_812616 [Thozetella sp. PMI_491]